MPLRGKMLNVEFSMLNAKKARKLPHSCVEMNCPIQHLHIVHCLSFIIYHLEFIILNLPTSGVQSFSFSPLIFAMGGDNLHSSMTPSLTEFQQGAPP